MNKKCTVKNEKKKLRKSEIMAGKNSNSLNKIQKIKKIFLDKPSDTMHNSKRPRILLKTFFFIFKECIFCTLNFSNLIVYLLFR